MLLAVPKIQELYFNLEVLLGELGLDSLDFSITSDIKMGKLCLEVTDMAIATDINSSQY